MHLTRPLPASQAIAVFPRCRRRSLSGDLEEFAAGRFERILPDAISRRDGEVSRVLMCTGKVYFDLERERERRGRNDVAIVRFEQLYPISDETLEAVLKSYRDGTNLFWVQEEPENMGAWRFLKARFGDAVFGRWPLRLISRPASASPATGSHSSHKKEQEQLIGAAFGQ